MKLEKENSAKFTKELSGKENSAKFTKELSG